MSQVDTLDATVQTQPELPLTALDLAFARYVQQMQPSTEPRHGWLAALTSHQFGRGHACLDLDLLAQNGVALLGWPARWQSVLPSSLPKAASSLPWVTGPVSPLVLHGPRLYLRRSWQAEQSIWHSITQRLELTVNPAPQPNQQTLSQLFEDSRQANDAPDWQKIACALALRGHLTIITGGPGTGKTTTVVRLLTLLQAQSQQPLRIQLAAPTGKAAARLNDSIAKALQQLPPAMQQHLPNLPTQAQTLHQLLQVRPGLKAKPAPRLHLDVLVVDEASMIDLELMARLMAATPIEARLILLGDKDQLASVEAGAVLGQLCQEAQGANYNATTLAWLQNATGQDLSAWAGSGSRLAQQTVMLRHSYRFANDSPIGQWARATNSGAQQELRQLFQHTPLWQSNPSAGVTRLGNKSDLADLVRSSWQPILTVLSHLSIETSDEEALALLHMLGHFQVLCALRSGPFGVDAINRNIAHWLGLPAQGWYPGRPVMITRNDYQLGLMNGDVGLCLPTKRGLRLAFASSNTNSKLRWILPSRLDALETVFAMTVHKSQGSEFDQVALVLPGHSTPILTRELLYTGITRAKTNLALLASENTLQQAAASRVLRSGGLGL